jgi:tRNA-Thr(GGU) m(6)t(6)A37 methyltransferase TsaA
MAAPVVIMYCKKSYPHKSIVEILESLKNLLAERLSCPADSVFLLVQRVAPEELLSFGKLKQTAVNTSHDDTIYMRPIGWVRSPVTEMRDDCWGDTAAMIQLDESTFTAEYLNGLSEFSHVEILFHFHKADPRDIVIGSKHPRERTDWPRVGVFAQRMKDRPNRIGLSTCAIRGIEGTRLWVADLDAIDGTPVLDIKPFMLEFAARGQIREPNWAKELMQNYYGRKH